MDAPKAKQIPGTTTIHGDVRTDMYAWLRDKNSRAVIDYLEAENAYTDEVMSATQPLQKTLYEEMISHIKEADDSVPAKRGPYYYYYRTEKGKQYRIYCRKKDRLESAGRVQEADDAVAQVRQVAQGPRDTRDADGGRTAGNPGR